MICIGKRKCASRKGLLYTVCNVGSLRNDDAFGNDNATKQECYWLKRENTRAARNVFKPWNLVIARCLVEYGKEVHRNACSTSIFPF